MEDIALTPGLVNTILLVSLWVIPWKGFVLWKAARNNHVGWFVAIMLINTMAILEILYIFYFSHNKKKDTSLQD